MQTAHDDFKPHPTGRCKDHSSHPQLLPMCLLCRQASWTWWTWPARRECGSQGLRERGWKRPRTSTAPCWPSATSSRPWELVRLTSPSGTRALHTYCRTRWAKAARRWWWCRWGCLIDESCLCLNNKKQINDHSSLCWRCRPWRATSGRRCAHSSLRSECARWSWGPRPGRSSRAEDCATDGGHRCQSTRWADRQLTIATTQGLRSVQPQKPWFRFRSGPPRFTLLSFEMGRRVTMSRSSGESRLAVTTRCQRFWCFLKLRQVPFTKTAKSKFFFSLVSLLAMCGIRTNKPPKPQQFFSQYYYQSYYKCLWFVSLCISWGCRVAAVTAGNHIKSSDTKSTLAFVSIRLAPFSLWKLHLLLKGKKKKRGRPW